MILITVLLIAVAVAAAALWMARARVRPATAAPETAMPDRRRPGASNASGERASVERESAAKPVEHLALEWDAPLAVTRTPGMTLDAKRVRIRDRYIAARFPGVLRGTSDLREIEYVIKVARHYFEEGRLDNAAELFALAIEQNPLEPTLRLAQLEIAFLGRDAELFTRLARELQAAIPGLPEWDEVLRLGRAVAPGEPLFGSSEPAGATGHYGPWPEMPNWIQASWDLTGEVLAADFHRVMAHRAAADNRPALRRVA